ncbi:MAG: response regulator [Leptospira sp.]|nr:response regulator [Leptospira sp.]
MSQLYSIPPYPQPKPLISKSRRPSQPVLIVEDREENQMLLAGLCQSMDVTCLVAENGAVALDIIKTQPISVYIVDLMMPVMDGKTFIRLLRERNPDAVILVQTAIDASEEIIEIMKSGVYDYLIKPLNIELMKTTLSRALEYRYLIDIEKNLLKEESKELRDQLEWLNYKESSRKSTSGSIEMNAIYNLKTTLTQGSGIGMMTTLIDTISQVATKEDQKVSIDSELFDLLKENNSHTKSMLRGLASAVQILENPVSLTKVSSSDLIDLATTVKNQLNAGASQKAIEMNLPIFKNNYTLLADLGLFKIALTELFLNAIKYAPSESVVDSFITIIDGYLCFSIKNRITEDIYSSQAEEVIKSLTLPFFRLHPPVESVHQLEPFSLGLGLTMVDYIANKHHGMFFLRKAKDYTTSQSSVCTIAEFFIPLQN